jgi:hypothetical protein
MERGTPDAVTDEKHTLKERKNRIILIYLPVFKEKAAWEEKEGLLFKKNKGIRMNHPE